MKDEEEDLSIPSIMTVCKDCKLGHCSCYYTNQNKCCRCKETQIDRTLIHRNVHYGDSRDIAPEPEMKKPAIKKRRLL